jgi:hypothetical protein
LSKGWNGGSVNGLHIKKRKGKWVMQKKLQDGKNGSGHVGEIEPECSDYGYETSVDSYECYGRDSGIETAVHQANLFQKLSAEARDLLTYILTGPTDVVWDVYVPACQSVYKGIKKKLSKPETKAQAEKQLDQGYLVLEEIREFLKECSE